MRLGVVADPHLSIERPDESASWHNRYRLADAHDRLVEALRHPLLRGVDVLAVLGDLAHFGDRASLDFVVDAVAALGVPAVLLSGNHDVLTDGVRLDLTTAGTAVEPFRAAGFGLDVLQVTDLTTRRIQPFDVIAERLAEGTPHVVLSHFPLLSIEDRCRDAGLLYAAHLDQLAPPTGLELPAGPTVILSGHLHLRAVTAVGDAIQVAFAALVEPPYEVATVDVAATPSGGIEVRYECASVRAPDAERLPVLDPAEGRWTWGGQTTFNATSTLPRVAFEYGHTSWALATTDSAVARSTFGA